MTATVEGSANCSILIPGTCAIAFGYSTGLPVDLGDIVKIDVVCQLIGGSNVRIEGSFVYLAFGEGNVGSSLLVVFIGAFGILNVDAGGVVNCKG